MEQNGFQNVDRQQQKGSGTRRKMFYPEKVAKKETEKKYWQRFFLQIPCYADLRRGIL